MIFDFHWMDADFFFFPTFCRQKLHDALLIFTVYFLIISFDCSRLPEIRVIVSKIFVSACLLLLVLFPFTLIICRSFFLFLLFSFHCVFCVDFCYVIAFLDFNWPPIRFFLSRDRIRVSFLHLLIVSLCLQYVRDSVLRTHISSICHVCVWEIPFKIEVSNLHSSKKFAKNSPTTQN